MSEDEASASHWKHMRVLELARNGMSSQAIAQQLELPVRTVKNYRSKSLVQAGAPLSEREAEVSKLAQKGLSNKAIAEQLGLSARTVEIHRQRALKKLGVRNPAELATKQVQSLIARVAELETQVAYLQEQLSGRQKA